VQDPTFDSGGPTHISLLLIGYDIVDYTEYSRPTSCVKWKGGGVKSNDCKANRATYLTYFIIFFIIIIIIIIIINRIYFIAAFLFLPPLNA